MKSQFGIEIQRKLQKLILMFEFGMPEHRGVWGEGETG